MTSRAANRRVYRALMVRQPRGWRDPVIAVALAAVYLIVLLVGLDQLGYARDEGFYFHAARSYQAWFELFASDPAAALSSVDAHWSVNHEHPSLVKSLMAWSHWLLWDRHPVFSMEGTSYRFPAMVLSALGVGLVYLWGARSRGCLAGVVAAGVLATLPRFFHHAHLACFDAPVVTIWLLAAYAWWRAMSADTEHERGLRRAGRLLFVGVSFGLALDTKHNAWFLPFVVALHTAAMVWLAEPDGRRRLVRRAALAGLAMATVGPLVFYASWPWIWHDTAARLVAYAEFHLGHVYYNMEFLGDNHWQPPMPRGYAPLMTLATVPLVALVTAGVGLAAAWRRRSRSDLATPALWLLAIVVPYAAWVFPTTPIFGGTKHWMTAYPFVALFAGLGVAEVCRWARVRGHREPRTRRWLGSPALELVVGAGVLVGPAVQALHAFPWGLSAYTPIVGGASGAAGMGLNRGFWGYTTGAPPIARFIDERAPRSGRVYLHDTARSAWDMMIRDGRLRSDLQGVLAMGRSDVALYHHEKHMSGVMYQAWGVFGTTAPAVVAGLDGVPVIWIYAPE
ncbi:MAG: glycosyltransferase family 39 protein [Polyangiaceae bacterium]